MQRLATTGVHARVRTLAATLLFVAMAVALLPVSQAEEAESEAVSAEVQDVSQVRQARGLTSRESKTGFTTSTPVFGGPTSPEGQLEEADRLTEPAFRFPKIDETLEPWFAWKTRQNQEHGIQLSAQYSTLFQGLSDTLPGGDDMASSGVLRGILQWTLTGKDNPNTGSLNIMLDHRHAYRDVAPANLGSEAGYIGQTGTFFGDTDFSVVNLNWQQRLNDGRTGFVAGRYDPNDYMNILGYVNPWSVFSNLAINLDASVAFPDVSWGVGVGHWITDQWYVLGGVNDANGVITDNLEFFDGGAEFFTYAHMGWSPSKADRYFKNFHVLVWHVDEREDAGIDSAKGVAFAANWTFDDRWMPFARMGFSSGTAPIYNDSYTLGLIRKFLYRSDLVGLSANYGSPPDGSLSNQTTIEAFWRIQFAQNLAITPSLQFLLDSALNPDDDRIWVYGMRFRLTF
jgi:porin